MEKGYFSAAWGDITKSPGWFSKILRMGLLNFIPIFGVLVTYGYLYGWARDIAWNVHRPMPDRIFGNEDGNLYKRGFFILVIGVVFSLVPGVFAMVTSILTGVSFVGFVSVSDASLGVGALLMGLIFSLAGLVLTFAVVFFYWVGAMRCALYGTLSSGFQIGKIWAMMRYDFTGLLRIFGMSVICGCVVGIATFIIAMLVVAFMAIFIAVFQADGPQAAVVGILIVLASVLLLCIAAAFVSVFIAALISRALGYWTRQFQVNLWGGQEDPMPFELEQAKQAQQHYQAYQAGQPYQAGQAQQPYQSAQQPYQTTQPYQAQQPYPVDQNQQPYQAGQAAQAGQTQQPYQVDQSTQVGQAQQPNQAGSAGQTQKSYQEGQAQQSYPADQVQQPYQPNQAGQAQQLRQSSQEGQAAKVQQPSQGDSSQGNFSNQEEQLSQPPVIEVEPAELSNVVVEEVTAASPDTAVPEATTAKTASLETTSSEMTSPETASPETTTSTREDETSSSSEATDDASKKEL